MSSCHRKICEEKFGGCKKSFSRLGQKVNKKIDGGDAYGHDADDSGSDFFPWPLADIVSLVSRQDILTPFNIIIKFEATEYLICIRNFEDIRVKFQIISSFVVGDMWPYVDQCSFGDGSRHEYV